MAKIAVDIALLLPESINQICVKINQRSDSEAYSDLSKKNNHPHITLAMAVIDEKDVDKVIRKLKNIASKFSKLSLEVYLLDYIINPQNKKSYAFQVKLTKELKRLHNTLLKEISSTSFVDSNMFFLDADEKFAEASKIWVKNYGKIHSDLESYHPHISLKCSKAKYNALPIKFFASTVALCNLGNYCTCRTILGSHNLSD